MCDEAGGCRDFTGNFRRVCPTLNRARAFRNLTGVFRILHRVRCQSYEKNTFAAGIFSGFYLEGVETPGRVFHKAEALRKAPPPT